MITPESAFYSAVKRFLAMPEGGLAGELNTVMPDNPAEFHAMLENAVITKSALEVGVIEAHAQREGAVGAPCSWGAVDCPQCGCSSLFPFTCLDENKEEGYYQSLLKGIAKCKECGHNFLAAGSLHEPHRLGQKGPISASPPMFTLRDIGLRTRGRRAPLAQGSPKSFWRRQFDFEKHGFALAWYTGIAVIALLIAWFSS